MCEMVYVCILYMEKILEGEKFWQMMQNSPSFFTVNAYKYSETTEGLPSDLQNNFLPFKFAHQRQFAKISDLWTF